MLNFERLQSETTEYLSELLKEAQGDPNNVDVLDTLAEAYLETGQAELAFPLLERSVELDPEGKKGYQKYYWLAQIYGGWRGLELFDLGIKFGCEAEGTESATQALLGMIEIWMTDLCMESQAEIQCEKLVEKALRNSRIDPETWSVLGSIRISQQRDDEARDALVKSWELYVTAIESGRVDNNMVPKLLRLAQSMLEVNLASPVLEITGQLHRMDDQIAEVYYLNALAHQVLIPGAKTPKERSQHIVAARDANVDMKATLEEEADPDIVSALEDLVKALPIPEIENPFEDDETPFELQ